ncbi:MAG TPA: hypothetical protein VFW98_13205 [Gemmatimonadaceae bacterium]|nr:hypothetical protein [Gemmatimonadaceae bacterium]
MLRRIAVAAGVIAVGLEVTLRAWPQLCPAQEQLKIAETTGFDAFVDDSLLGARPQPLVRETVHTADYRYAVALDSLGFPNHEPWPSHPDIAVLGNSLAVGPGVGMDGQFTTLMQRALAGRSVLNLGLPGGSPAQELRIYQAYLRALHPRVVIATVWVASDVDNATQFAHWRSEGAPPDFTAYRERFGTTHGGRTELKRIRDALSRSYLLRAVYYAGRGLVRSDSLTGQVNFPDGEMLLLSVRAQRRLARGATRADVALASDFIRPLSTLRAAADSDGARFVVVLLPSKEEIYGATTFPAVLATVRDVRAALSAAGLPMLDLYSLFRARGSERPPFYEHDIHFNAYGNQLVAQALDAWIVDSVPSTPHTPRSGAGGG